MLLIPIRIFPVSGNRESWSGSCFLTIYEFRSLFDLIHYVPSTIFHTGAVGNVSGYRCVLTADPGVASSIPVRSYTFVEIDHDMISTVILLPSADSFKKGCCQLQAKVCARITG